MARKDQKSSQGDELHAETFRAAFGEMSTSTVSAVSIEASAKDSDVHNSNDQGASSSDKIPERISAAQRMHDLLIRVQLRESVLMQGQSQGSSWLPWLAAWIC